ncbi:MAG TPA: DUF58 domain-containing protein [Isosphaeraceae bacterium]|jgi:uncharacterized protein (DUF58 family)|nr:DUF58 domain-containing protein [Isosphaeraceae bacterium]
MSKHRRLFWFGRKAEVEPDEATRAPLDAAAIVRQARRLRFRVKPGAVADLSGAYLGARPGTGLTFAELRAYEPGDDVRHLDWNVTARQGKPYVRRFVEERALTLWLIVDVSASLRFGPEGRTKADRAAQAAALLAAAAIRNGDRAGLALVSDRVEAEVEPGGGARHLARLLRALVATPATSRRTCLSVGLGRLRRSARRGLIVALSDFLTPEPVGHWRRAARRHEVVAIRLVDPREDKLPDAGLIDLEDAEQGTRQAVDAGSRRLREAYAEAARQRRSAFRSWSSDVGLTGFEISTADDPLGPLLRFFRGRAARRGVL